MSDILSLKNVSFSYGNNNVLTDFSLSVEEGSFTTLLGASGSGKTTILKIMAGFLSPTKGSVILNGKDVTKIPVEKRNIGFVFQDYALFPHLTVKENLLFGFSHSERKNQKENLEETVKSLNIENLLSRYPHELSGGQQQRVALGRSLMLKPKIILMDEPLSSLDAKLRLHVREELLEIQKQIGITTVYVTHDQEEAFSLSSKIAVLHQGNLVQYDTPRNVYYYPNSKTSAELSGMTNYIKSGKDVVMVRPEWIEFSDKFTKNEKNQIQGRMISSSFLGSVTRCRIETAECEGGILTVDSHCSNIPKTDSKVYLVYKTPDFC
ncbi:MAG: ABC transporter ATP-binding protein [Treponema sp.]|nr:ABC transporter ATP-binding protein [Treponema sp.]